MGCLLWEIWRKLTMLQWHCTVPLIWLLYAISCWYILECNRSQWAEVNPSTIKIYHEWIYTYVKMSLCAYRQHNKVSDLDEYIIYSLSNIVSFMKMISATAYLIWNPLTSPVSQILPQILSPSSEKPKTMHISIKPTIGSTSIFHYCCYIKHKGIITNLTLWDPWSMLLICQNITMWICRAWIRKYYILW